MSLDFPFLTQSSLYVQSKSQDSDSDDDDDGDDDSVVDWDADDSSSSSSDDDAEGLGDLKGRAKWLKKVPAASNKKKDKRASEDPDKAKPADIAAASAKKESQVISRDHDAIMAPKSVIPEQGLTAALVNKKVQEITNQRGRRGTDSKQLLRQLEGLSRMSIKYGPRVEIPILMHVVSAQFGLQRTIDDYMDTATWRSCSTYLERISEVIVDDGYRLCVQTIDEADLLGGTAKNANLMKAAAAGADGAMAAVAADEKLINPHTDEQETEDERAERLRVEKEAGMTEQQKKTIPVVGSLALHLTRLEEEYTKSLLNISHYTQDYVTRLRDESKLVSLLAKIQTYFEREGMADQAAQMAQMHVEHTYYRHDLIARQVDKAAEFYDVYGEVSMLHPACVSNEMGSKDTSTSHPASISGKPSLDDAISVAETTNWTDRISNLCTYVYKYGTDQAKKRATICQVYHHALHDRYLAARDLLLMSHLQENIYDVGDISTMIMFNRMMVQLGMCAFRQGRIWEAHQCLTEICSGKVRELLAQGMSLGRFSDKTPEEEKAEKRRQVPYHQHINLDLLEACHLISAMLLEIPNIAAASALGDLRRSRPISRTFRKHQDIYRNQVFTGPPETTREYVMRGAKALSNGDWKTCVELCTSIDVWNLLPGEGSADKVKAILSDNIKLEGLRTYLFAFAAQYDSLSLSQLCAMFEMSKNEVHSVASKMMINRELFASWDQPTDTIVLRKVEPSPIQVMALQFAEKANNLVEANERLLDASAGNKEERWGRGRDHDGDRRDGGDRRYEGGHQDRRRDGGRGGRDGDRGGGRGGRDGGRGGRGRRQGGRGGGGRGSGGRGGGRGRGSQQRYSSN